MIPKIIGYRVCKECGQNFGYTAYRRGRELCNDCTYQATLKKIAESNGTEEGFNHDDDGYPNYVMAYIRESREPLDMGRIVGECELGVKSGTVGSHHQYHSQRSAV